MTFHLGKKYCTANRLIITSSRFFYYYISISKFSFFILLFFYIKKSYIRKVQLKIFSEVGITNNANINKWWLLTFP